MLTITEGEVNMGNEVYEGHHFYLAWAVSIVNPTAMLSNENEVIVCLSSEEAKKVAKLLWKSIPRIKRESQLIRVEIQEVPVSPLVNAEGKSLKGQFVWGGIKTEKDAVVYYPRKSRNKVISNKPNNEGSN